MSFLIGVSSSATSATVGASATDLATALDGTKAPGLALYKICGNTGMWYAQGIGDTAFTNDHTTSINTATGHKLRTGMPVQVSNSGGALPTGLSAATTYWANVIDANTFYLYDTLAHAQAGGSTGKKTTTDDGSGTQTMTTVATAGAGSKFLPAGTVDYCDGAFGAKISVLQDSTGGTASCQPVGRV